MKNSEKIFLADVKKQLDESVDNLDGHTRSRLSQIRSQALDNSQQRHSTLKNWLWAGGVTVPALALGLMIFFGIPGNKAIDRHSLQIATTQIEEIPPSYDVAAIPTSPATLDNEDLGILMSDEEIEMLSDLDFLTWLSNENEVGG